MARDQTQRNANAAAFGEDDLVCLFGGLSQFQSLLVAVSGGSDSVALMHLVARWANGLAGSAPHIEVATIDHGLRPGSADEAGWVGEQAARLDLVHNIRTWEATKPSTGIQARARQARYQLLAEIVAERQLPPPTAILTAHTKDDQAETVLMRLARGSGVDGLSAMAPQRTLQKDATDIALVRPLLDVSKARLVAWLKSLNECWKEDSSNWSPVFERVNVRAAMEVLERQGVSRDSLALSARRVGRARVALEVFANQFLDANVALHDGAYADLSRRVFDGAPAEIQVRVLKQLLLWFGGSDASARLSQIESLQAQLAAGDMRAVTLGGCIVVGEGERISVFRETGRNGLETVALRSGESVLWDCRFEVSVVPQPEGAALQPERVISVRSLGAETFARLRGDLRPAASQLPARAVVALPSFWLDDTLIEVPMLGFRATQPEGRHTVCRAQFIGAMKAG